MKRAILIIMMILFILINTYAARLDVGQDKIVRVNNKVITVKELEKFYLILSKYLPENQRPTKKYVLQALIQQELILQEIAINKTIVMDDNAFKKVMDQQREVYTQYKQAQDKNYKFNEQEFKIFVEQEMKITFEEYEQRMRDNVIIQQFLRKKAEPKIQEVSLKKYDNPKDFPVMIPNQQGGYDKYNSLREFYDRNAQMFIQPKNVVLKHIFTAKVGQNEKGIIDFLNDAEKEIKKKKIEDAYKRLKAGENFDEICLLYSEDTESRDIINPMTKKVDRGFIGPVFISGPSSDQHKKQFGEELFVKLFELNKGQLTGVMEGYLGYHVFLVVDKSDVKIVSYEESKNEIVNLFKQYDSEKLFADEITKVVEQLKAKASIEYYLAEYKEDNKDNKDEVKKDNK